MNLGEFKQFFPKLFQLVIPEKFKILYLINFLIYHSRNNLNYDNEIIDSVPKTMQNHAQLLIQKLKDHSDVISWNDNEQLVLEGSIVPKSNIVDLVNGVMRKRKGFNPEHSNTFAKALAKINVPEDYVRNPDRIDSIRWYHRLQDSLAPGPSFVSESVEAPTEVPRKHPKAQQLLPCLWKVVKSTSLIEL